MHPFSLPPVAKKAEVALDPQFDASIATLADAVIEEEQKDFTPGLESFQVYSNKLRHEVRNSMISFQQKFQKGYEIISQWLSNHQIENPEIAEEKLAILDDFDQFISQINDGNYIFQILGFSEETMVSFYKAAYQLAQDKDYPKGRDAFFFLVTIAPDVADFWLGLSICTTQLKETDQALDASIRTIELDPTCTAAYQNALYLYSQTKELEKAHELCKQGIAYCDAHNQEPWAQGLKSTLRDAQESFGLPFSKGEYHE